VIDANALGGANTRDEASVWMLG